MQARRFRADLHHVNGSRLVIISTSWQTAALMAPQDKDYRVFVVALHERMANAGSNAKLSGGVGRRVYAAGGALLGLVGAGVARVLVRALAIREVAGAAVLVGF